MQDTGIGMTNEVKANARDPFFTTKPVGKGSGLGLSMVEGYVRQSGGHLIIHSAPGVGTQVSMLMPKAARHADSSPAKPDGTRHGSGQTILVIEDNRDLAALFAKQLRRLNYKAVYAVDRLSALNAAEHAGGSDLVLSDVMLANGERGPDIVAELRAQYPDMVPIFMTGYASDDDIELINLAKKGQSVLRKPFKIEDLAKAVSRAAKPKPNQI